MGLFSKKETCTICGGDCGVNSSQLKDGSWICSKCSKNAGLGMLMPAKKMTSDDVKGLIKEKEANANRLAAFQVTQKVGSYLYVDENAREWYTPDGFLGKVINPQIHSFDDILDFELLEDGGTIAKGGLGRAVVGGVLFGGVGAVVGGVTGKKKGKPTCTSLKVKITLNDMECPAAYINLIETETKKDSMTYQACERIAQEILSLLQVMVDSNKATQATTTQEVSAADEILKFKQLLDNGIITQEEFDAKKKQLLGL